MHIVQVPICFMNNTEWNFTECGLQSNGDANLVRLSDIMEVSVCRVKHHGNAQSLGDLLLYRGGLVNYETQVTNLQNIYICEKHLKEYGEDWAQSFIQRTQRRGKKLHQCMFPADVDGFVVHTQPVVANSRHYVTKDHVKTLFNQKHLLLPLGARKI